MPLINHAQHELHLKIVYYGPGLGGKTTNLEFIHRNSKVGSRGKLISLTNEAERTLFFDLLPVDLGTFRGFKVRLHLCTVPGQIARDSTRRLVLHHVDGVVFVVDSQHDRIDQNVQSIENLYRNLRLQGDDPDVMPLVVQYNKRDLPGAMLVEDLQELLGVPPDVVEVEASALQGWGVFETLKHITKGCLRLIGNPSELPDGRSPSILPGKRASMLPATEHLVTVPKIPAAKVPQVAGVPAAAHKTPGTRSGGTDR